MKKYTVSIPIAGALHIEVTADSKEEAKDAAWERFNNEGEDAGDLEWQAHTYITRGNICSVQYNDVEVSQS